jgi:putative membrane protein
MRLLLVLLVAAWCAGTARLWRSAGVGHGVSRAGAACFVLALGALALALLSPIDALAESRFSVHMVQHLLLVAVVPPLFVLGSPWFRSSGRCPARRGGGSRRWASRW